MGSFLYFLQRPINGGPVKVGFSNDPRRRCEEIATSLGEPLDVIATTPGGRSEEGDWHRRFAHARMKDESWSQGRTEWFLLTQPVADYIASIGGAARGPVLRDFDASFVGRDGQRLLDAHLTSRGLKEAQAAAELPCATASVRNWRRGLCTPDEIAAEMLDLWSRGAVPEDSWLTRNGVAVAPCLDHPSNLSPHYPARIARLGRLRSLHQEAR